MSNKLHTLIGIVLFLSLVSIPAMSQNGDQTTGTTKVENTENKHVVKKSTSTEVSNSVKKGYHATTRATGKAWRATKKGVSKGYHATAQATGKAWRGTKKAAVKGYHSTAQATGTAWKGTKKAVAKGYNSTVHPSKKTNPKTDVKQTDHVNQEGETK